jgi:ribose transport system ATP-binding protein
VLLLHEPTQGVDAGAKKDILELILQAAANGAAVLVFSSDIDEISQICNRVHVMRYGQIVASVEQASLTVERLMALSQADPAA